MRVFLQKDLTVPNVITFFRILMALTAGLMFFLGRETEIAAGLCIVASSLDYFDGWYARKYSQKTKLGAHLDPFADKVLNTVVFIALGVVLNWLWLWLFIGIIVMREVTITIYRMKVKRNSGIFIPASRMGKLKTALQCLVGDVLIFYIFIYPGTIPGNQWLIFVFMTVTLFITVDSGLRYLLPNCSDGKKRSVLERLYQWVFNMGAKGV